MTDKSILDRLFDEIGQLRAENDRLRAVCEERDRWVASNARQRDAAEDECNRLRATVERLSEWAAGTVPLKSGYEASVHDDAIWRVGYVAAQSAVLRRILDGGSQRGPKCCTSDSHEGHASPTKWVYVDSISDSQPPDWDVPLDSPEPTDSEDRMNRNELREALIEVAERTTDHSTDLSPMAGEEIADALLAGPVGELLAEVERLRDSVAAWIAVAEAAGSQLKAVRELADEMEAEPWMTIHADDLRRILDGADGGDRDG